MPERSPFITLRASRCFALALTVMLSACKEREQSSSTAAPATLPPSVHAEAPPLAPAPAPAPAQQRDAAPETPVVPAPALKDPPASQAKTPEPKTPEPKTPEPKTPEPKTPEPKTPEPKTPQTPVSAVTTQPTTQPSPAVSPAGKEEPAEPPVAPAVERPAVTDAPARQQATPAPVKEPTSPTAAGVKPPTPAVPQETRKPVTPAAQPGTPSGRTVETAPPAPQRSDRVEVGQLRGLWVDAFGPGFKTPEQVDQLIADAQAMRVNVLFAQVGKRGDCYCNHSSMPRTLDPEVPPGFDPLQDLIDKAHAAGIQVHAWIITTAIVNIPDNPTPAQPDHVFNTNGLHAQGVDDWLTRRADGEARAGNDYLLDPGHPDAAAYIAEMYQSVVRNYDVDGVQLDRVRYPDAPGAPIWGYNPTALARYQAETGVRGVPDASDPRWMAWRRQQVNHLVRRVYLGVKSIKPHVWVDVATITYGPGPRTIKDFQRTRTYNEVLQDWPEWTRQGYLDLNVLMNYKRDDDASQARWFAEWNDFARTHRGARYVAAGAAMYLNQSAGTVRQAAQALSSGLDGWVGYSYRTTDAAVNAGKSTTAQAVKYLAVQLTRERGPFTHNQPWGRPDTRALRAVRGVVTASDRLGGRAVELLVNGRAFARTETDGNGEYGFVFTPLGEFEVRVEGAAPVRVTALPGQVTQVPTLTLP